MCYNLRLNMLLNHKNKMNGLELLSVIESNSIPCVFFDPQYREDMNALAYGNEGIGRGKNRCSLPQMSTDTITVFATEIARVLKESGHLFLWVNKFILREGVADIWFKNTGLTFVDMLIWDKKRIGQGRRTRCRFEVLLVLQKPPKRAVGIWNDHGIPDVWEERIEQPRKKHAHSKPIQLQSRLISAVTQIGDIVLDPCAGGYSVLDACKRTGRNFLGCDIQFGEEMQRVSDNSGCVDVA